MPSRKKSPRCQGYTLSGQRCKRHAAPGQRFCVLHARSSEIGLPPYVVLCDGRRFSVYLPVGASARTTDKMEGVRITCPSCDRSYDVGKYVSGGTYGNVYECSMDGSAFIIKMSKNSFKFPTLSVPTNDDFCKEFYMYDAITKRVPVRGIVVNVVDALMLKTVRGYHGCVVMEKMDGTLTDLFKKICPAPSKAKEMFIFWMQVCKFISFSLVNLHERNIYHMDVKGSNILYKMLDGSNVALRLGDLGLGCYMSGVPPLVCEATGTYLPPEWRTRGSPRRCTYEKFTDSAKAEVGDNYSMNVMCYKLLTRFINQDAYKDNKGWIGLVNLVKAGGDDAPGRRVLSTPRGIYDLVSRLLRDQANGS